jgi:hypothetical protein
MCDQSRWVDKALGKVVQGAPTLRAPHPPIADRARMVDALPLSTRPGCSA